MDGHLAVAVALDEAAERNGAIAGDVEVGLLAVLDSLGEDGDRVADALAVDAVLTPFRLAQGGSVSSLSPFLEGFFAPYSAI